MHETQELKNPSPLLPQLPEAWAQPEEAAEAVCNLYVIIDCGHTERTFYDAVRQDQRLQSKTLFAGTVHEESASAGPLLVQIDFKKAADFVRNLQVMEQQNPCVVWLWSDLPFAAIFPKLKGLVFGEDADRRKHFYRYFDPRNLPEFLEMFKVNEERARVLNTIRGWAFMHEGKYVLLRGRAGS